ncbi:MAG: D-alanine--poly(phosphoribitol) ligase subunit DltC [Chthoniobacterales bacterium]
MPHSSDAFRGEVLTILSDLTGLPDLQNFLDLNLFDEGLLDSLTLVRLLVELSSHFHINLTPADVVREEWSTPRGILQSVESHLPA